MPGKPPGDWNDLELVVNRQWSKFPIRLGQKVFQSKTFLRP
jgi:hypothetical protein